MKKIRFSLPRVLTFVLMLSFIFACEKDDDIAPDPTADFTVEPGYQNPLEVTFESTSTGVESFTWDFGDGESVSGKNAWHLYDAAGQYTVTLTATGGEGSTPAVVEKTITVEEPPAHPTADFTFEDSSDNRFEFTFTSTTTSAEAFEWDFGDGTTSTEENPTHIYEEGGEYTIELIVTGDERTLPAKVEKTLTIIPDPTADFSYEISAENSLEVMFTSTATDAETFTWDFGDGETSTEENPTHTYAGTGDYDVTLTVTGVERATPAEVTKTVSVIYDPVVKLEGTIIGHEGSWDGVNGLVDAAFDGDFGTFVDAPAEFASTGYVGYDLGEDNAAILSSVKFAARGGLEGRMLNGEIRGSNDPSLTEYDVLYTITEAPTSGEFTEVEISSEESYRYIYYVTGPNGYTNIAELEFYGEMVSNE